MNLEQELDDFRAQFARTAPAGRVALYDVKVEELRGRFPLKDALSIGQVAPDFSLPDTYGKLIRLSDALRSGPAIVTFYRGDWCPYCNLELRAYQRLLPEITHLGGRVMAISPQLPDGSLSTREKNELQFDVLSDTGNDVARSFGLVYSLPEELREALRGNGKALPGINGDESWELPLPATFVIAPDRRVTLAFVEIDYRKRLDPDDIVVSLRSLHAANSVTSDDIQRHG